jgi:S1-C subfamily serine protease
MTRNNRWSLAVVAIVGFAAYLPVRAEEPIQFKHLKITLSDDAAWAARNDSVNSALKTLVPAEPWKSPQANGDRLRGDGAEVFAKVAPATMVVKTPNGHGTGFVISADGWIITNNHVIEDAHQDPATGARRVQIFRGRFDKGLMTLEEKPYAAEVFKADPKLDLALLKLVSLPDGEKALPFLKLSDQGPKNGMKCYAIGHPAVGMLWSVRDGLVTGVGRFPHDRTDAILARLPDRVNKAAAGKTLQADDAQVRAVFSSCLIYGGDSGGALVDDSGNVIAVTFARGVIQGMAVAGFSYHIHGEELAAFIKDRPAAPPVFVPHHWPSEMSSVELMDLDRDGYPETVVLGTVLNGRRTPMGFLCDFSKQNPNVKAADLGNAKARDAWKFQFGFHGLFVRRAFYDTTGSGQIDLILCDQDEDGKADVVLRRTKQGWSVEKATGQPLVDPSLFENKELRAYVRAHLPKLFN